MTQTALADLHQLICSGQLVPYLGPGALQHSIHGSEGTELPAGSDELILALNGGQPMAPRLMYEFPRAAMNLELKRGRKYVTQTLTGIYDSDDWSIPPLYSWLASLQLPYIIDINRDTLLQRCYADRGHTLVQGVARVGGSDYRFRIHQFRSQAGSQSSAEEYEAIEQTQVETDLPVIFKPMGSPLPDPVYVASDADYVDYITELMGGFAVPDFVKQYRRGKQYLLLGMRLTRDTERMVLSDLTYAADEPRGWALIADPTAKERRFCERIGLQLLESTIDELLATAGADSAPSVSVAG